MEKTAVYVGTRNVYEDLQTSCKSLFANSDVDTVYLFVEDDVFPLPMPDEVKIINVSGQEFFKPDGPNSQSRWTYMAMMKVALTKYLKKVNRALMLDYDTIVVDDISELWGTKLGKCYWAGVPNLGIVRPVGNPTYYNAGVALMNYELIRKDKMDDAMIQSLNTYKAKYLDQDVLNDFSGGHIKELPLRFNESGVTGWTREPAIVHYVGINKVSGGINGERRYFYNAYKTLDWPDIKEKREARYGKSLTI